MKALEYPNLVSYIDFVFIVREPTVNNSFYILNNSWNLLSKSRVFKQSSLSMEKVFELFDTNFGIVRICFELFDKTLQNFNVYLGVRAFLTFNQVSEIN